MVSQKSNSSRRTVGKSAFKYRKDAILRNEDELKKVLGTYYVPLAEQESLFSKFIEKKSPEIQEEERYKPFSILKCEPLFITTTLKRISEEESEEILRWALTIFQTEGMRKEYQEPIPLIIYETKDGIKESNVYLFRGGKPFESLSIFCPPVSDGLQSLRTIAKLSDILKH